jgi:hypothetical protein
MKNEKLILSIAAILFGLVVAGIAFFIFQTTKTVPANTKIVSIVSPSPTPLPSISLTLDRPKDEEVVNDKVLTVSGKTQSNAVVVVLTDSSEDVVSPSADGAFSTTVNLSDGQNMLEVSSIAPNGESVIIKKTVTYSQEEF